MQEPIQVPESTPFYDWASYIHPEVGLGDPVIVSTHGVQIGDIVISVVNGSLCANPAVPNPDSINFGAYIADVIANAASSGQAKMVVWDPGTAQYVDPAELA